MGSLHRWSLLSWFCLSGFGCTSIEYASGGSGGDGVGASGASPPAGGAPQGAGGTGGVGGEGGEGGGPGGGPGSGGEGGCLGPDACDGTDGDCDGWVDDPLGDTGLACGCYWGIFEGRRYVACEFSNYAQTTCPPNMQVAIPQTKSEQDFIGLLGAPTVYSIMVGLAQDESATSASSSWSWERPGVPIVWADAEPNDWLPTRPPFLETGAEQCGDIQGATGLNDNFCSGGVWVACEEVTDECVADAPCALALGCEGTFDCSLSTDSCVAEPSAETCNGRDDDCNGFVDDGDACNCIDIDGAHRFCGPVTSIHDAHCGEDWSLATLDDQEEFDLLLAALAPAERHLVGLVQRTTAMSVDEAWQDRSGTTPSGLVSYWASDEPNDDDLVESHAEDCAAITFGGLIDQPCEGVLSYFVCELD